MVLGAAGCSSETSEPESEPSRAAAPSPPLLVDGRGEAEFLRVLRDVDPGARTVSDATLTDAGRETCAALDRGATASQVLRIGRTQGKDTGQATVLAAAIFICPEYRTAMASAAGVS